MKHSTAIALLEIHASNCENNAVIQEREGQFEDAANCRSNAVDYRAAIAELQPASALSEAWSVKMQATAEGKYVATGIGLGLGESSGQFLVSADRFATASPQAE
jgi:predicted phage tail protein